MNLWVRVRACRWRVQTLEMLVRSAAWKINRPEGKGSMRVEPELMRLTESLEKRPTGCFAWLKGWVLSHLLRLSTN